MIGGNLNKREKMEEETGASQWRDAVMVGGLYVDCFIEMSSE